MSVVFAPLSERFLGFILSGLATFLLIVAYNYVYQSEKDEISQQLEFRQEVALDQARRTIGEFIGAAERDLAYMSRSDLLAQAFSGASFDVSKWTLLGDQWADLMLSRIDLYDQLRLIDNFGNERLRVNNINDSPRLVTSSELQSKVDRYYFTETLELEPFTLYLSDFDLNVEGGAIEIPIKPTLRLLTPFVDIAGNKKGIVSINYMGELMLNALRDIGVAWGQEIWLTNSEGYWLIGPSKDLEWGFMYPNRAPERVQNRFPEFWSALQLSSANELTKKTEEAYLLTGKLVQSAIRYNNLFDTVKVHNDSEWTLIAAHPESAITARLQSLVRVLVPSFLVVWLVLVGLSFWGARQINLKRHAMRETEIREQQFLRMLEAAPDATLLSDNNGIITQVNKATETLLGYKPQELIGQSIDRLVPERIHHSHPVMRAHYLMSPAPRSVSSRNRLTALHKDGHEIHVSVALNTVEVSGKVQVISAVRDMTVDYEASRELLQLTQRLDMAADASNMGIWEYDTRDGSVIWDERMYRQYGLNTDFDLNFSSWMNLIDEDYQDSIRRRIRVTILDGDNLDMVVRATNLHGDEIWIRIIATTKLDPDGMTQTLVGTQLDVTDEVKVERELRIAYEKASEANVELEALNQELSEARELAELSATVKSDFLANMSHEIRTPLNAVLGINHLLERQLREASARELIAKQDRAAQSLLAIINDVLDFSKIESGKLDIEQSPFSIMELLDNLTTLVSSQANDKSLGFIVVPPPLEFSSLIGDYMRLEQVLVNLCSNAIKFTEQGEVRLTVSCLKQDGNKLKVKFSVSDTGIGIAPGAQNVLFDPFTQADASISRRFGGSGLGLSISSRLVTLMGGSLNVESEVNRGSTFSFELPLYRQAIEKTRLVALQNCDVFIAHQSKSVRTSLEAALASFGAKVHSSIHAEEWVDKIVLEPSLQNRNTTLILDSDAYMAPDLDHLLKPIYPLKDENWPVVVLVSNTDEISEQNYPDTKGLNLFLHFPVGPLSLYQELVRARNTDTNELVSNMPNEKRLKGFSLLVVDDNRINLDVAKMMFEDEGATVWLAENGREALRFLRRGDHVIDLVLMDVQMPEMDGLEATRRIRADLALNNLPVLALTAGVTPMQRSAAMEAGMTAFIAKPIDVDRAVMLIRSIANRVNDGFESIESFDEACDDVVKPLINDAYGLRVFKTRVKYRRYLKLFAQMYDDTPSDLLALVDKPDALRSTVHKLRGAAGHLGLEQVRDLCAEIEIRLEEHQPLDDRPRVLADTIDATLVLIRQRFLADEAREEGSSSVEMDKRELIAKIRAIHKALTNYDLDGAANLFVVIESQLATDQRGRMQKALDMFDTKQAIDELINLATQMKFELE